MKDLLRRLLTLLAVLTAAVALGACGDDDDDGGDGGGGGEARQGGSITISQTSQPDRLDPALAVTANAAEPLWLVYMPLLTYKRAEGAEGGEIIPGAAEALPEISEDGKTYRLTLREGLKYSDGTPAKASDFERVVQRILNLESGWSSFWTVIEGGEEYVEAGEAEADIPGIETNDQTREITITLSEPAGYFSNVLANAFGGLVPGDTPFRDMTRNPPPGLGPYMITESVPNRQFVLEKNPNFNIPGIPAGNLDRITTRIIKNAQRQAQDVIRGDLDYMQDPPPADIKPEVRERYGDRYEEHITASTYYFFLNQKIPPFNDPKVREAVNIGVDKPALARVFAGEVQPGCSFIPPGIAGFDEALDVEECPFGNPNQPPDIERARQLIQEAGVDGMELTVWGNNDDPTDKVTQAWADQLERMGFRTNVEILDGGVYFQTIGNENTENLHTGFLNWFQDFPHPYDFMFLVSGATIQPTNNQNPGNVDDEEVTEATERLKAEPELTDEVVNEWREANRKLVERAHVVPYGHRKLATFLSERMDFENCSLFHPLYFNDYSSFCLK